MPHLGAHHDPTAVDSFDPVVSTDAATQDIQSFPVKPLKNSDMQDVIEPEKMLTKRTNLNDTISGDAGALHDVYYHELDSNTPGVCVVGDN
jgi:hypothetical protein